MDPIINLNGKNTLNYNNLTIVGGVNICVHLTNCHGIVFNNCKFTNSTERGVRLDNCYNITFNNCYFENLVAGIYAFMCTGGIQVLNSRFKNMSDPLLTTKGRGNAVQFNTCSGKNNKINNNKMQNNLTLFVGDVINLSKCNGTSDSYIEVLNNQLRGGGTNNSYGPAGIVGGDLGGSYQNISNNILVDTGYVGIQTQGGTRITCQNNRIFGVKGNTWSGVGLGCANYSGVPAGTGSIMSNNRINWWGGASNYRRQSDLVYKPENNNTKPAGFDTNTHDSTLSDAILPNPLWSDIPPSGKTVIAGKTVIIK